MLFLAISSTGFHVRSCFATIITFLEMLTGEQEIATIIAMESKASKIAVFIKRREQSCTGGAAIGLLQYDSGFLTHF
jgi:hypothetical protein